MTCQLVSVKRKPLQIRQFDDVRRNWPYTKLGQISGKRELVNWFTTVLFAVELRLQDHWLKLWIYRPVSWFELKWSFCKFANFTMSGGIGPIQRHDKTAKKGWWWTKVHHGLIWHRVTPSRSLSKIAKISTCKLVFRKRKLLQICQFDDFGRNCVFTKSRQNSKKREMVNWLEMRL
jgi:hypothetical protein